MKKRFALYGMFAAMAIFAAACGDDSSSSASAPEDEEYSSSVDDEESSSSEEAVSSSSTKKDGKSSSSEAKKDGKSSSSEAKKDDESSSSEKSDKSSSSEAKKDDKSSSSEKSESSSSEPESSSSEPESSSSVISYEPSCTVKTEGSIVTMNVYIYTDDKGEDKRIMSVDYENFQVSQISNLIAFGLTSCEEAKNMFGNVVESCSAEDGTIVLFQKFPSKNDLEQQFGTIEDAEKMACSSLLSEYVIDTTALNQDMLKAGKYGTFRDTRDAMLYRTIKVGDQTWMAQNMNYETKSGSSCYNDPVPEGTINGYCETLGRLYTWETAQTVCPDGWRLPTPTEWNNLLVKTMGADSATVDMGMPVVQYSTAGVSLLGGDTLANTYGLSFILGGAYGNPGFADAEYNALGVSGSYWLDEGDGKVSMAIVLYFGEDENAQMLPDLEAAQMQFSVRCIKK